MTVTARVGGIEAGGPPSGMSWLIEYDDATRAVTATAQDAGWCYVTVTVTSTITRTVAFYPAATGLTGNSQNPDLAARMAAADFRVVADGSTVTLVTGINPNQVSRLVGKAGTVVGGLPSSSEWSRA
jgi:hypothetical protein